MDVPIVQKILKANDDLAGDVRSLFEAHNLTAVNLMSSPGAGKTSLIEAALPLLTANLRVAVIEGDPETALDAERIAIHNVPVVQIETAGGCHLEAHLVKKALDQFDLNVLDLVLIENVGNLICPAEFDLGESYRVAVVSVPEGHDKPVKYPKVFRMADAIVLNKADLLPHVPFDTATFDESVTRLNPRAPVMRTSCMDNTGIDAWTAWLRSRIVREATI